MIGLILMLAILGFVVYLIQTYVPMPPVFKMVIYVVVAVVLILYLMRVFGIADIPVPQAR
jgi:hypothetical protein